MTTATLVVACLERVGRKRYHASFNCVRGGRGEEGVIVTTPERSRSRHCSPCWKCWDARGYEAPEGAR